jgi:hypothetical protein
MIVAHVTPSITTIYSKVPAVSTNLVRVCADLTAVGPQFLLRCAFALVLPIFTHIAATLSNIAPDIATIRSDVPDVRSNLFPVRSQLATFRRLKPASI